MLVALLCEPHQSRHDVEQRGGDRSDAHRIAAPQTRVGDRLLQALRMVHELLHRPEKGFSFAGQPNPAAGAGKQSHPEGPLEELDLLAERGVGPAGPPRPPTRMTFPGPRPERPGPPK